MLDALEATLADVQEADADAIVVGGDVVGGPQPGEVLRRLRALDTPTHWIRGNGDREAANGVDVAHEQREVVEFTISRLSAEELRFLGALPERIVLDVAGLGPTLFCHATPRSDVELITAATPEQHLARVFAGVAERTVVVGHTHMQLDARVGDVRLVNPGSVGMAYEGDVAAFWAVVGPDVELRRTPFDVERAAAAIETSGWPDARAFVDENLRVGVTRAEAIEAFERMAVERGERG